MKSNNEVAVKKMGDAIVAKLVKNPQVIQPRTDRNFKPSHTPGIKRMGGQSKGGIPGA